MQVVCACVCMCVHVCVCVCVYIDAPEDQIPRVFVIIYYILLFALSDSSRCASVLGTNLGGKNNRFFAPLCFASLHVIVDLVVTEHLCFVIWIYV